MSSNYGEKVLNSIEIGWTQDLRVQHTWIAMLLNIHVMNTVV